MTLPIYDIVFNPAEDIGLTAISFVDLPAIEQTFIYQGKDSQEKYSLGQILMASAEKHEVISPVLIPNQLILRINENGEKYYVRWSKEVIEQVANFYIMNQFQNNFTFQHSWFETGEGNYEDSFLKDVYMQKMWIIDDAKTDEANKVYGYHLPEGTLMVKLKIHNRKLWAKIKSGEVKGLSIEAFIPVQESGKVSYSKNKNLNNDIKMDKTKLQKLFDNFMLWYSQVSEDAKELADIAASDETESGEVSLKYFTNDTDYIEIATDGTATASDGSAVEDGEYALADGSVLVIEDGKFKETKVKEETDEPEPVEAPIAEASEDDDESKEDGEEPKEETPADETDDEEKKDEEETQAGEEPEEVEPPYTLVEIDINGEVFNVPQPVFDYIKSLEEQSAAGENFRKELAKLQSVTPSAKPVGNVVKQETAKGNKENVADFSSLIANMNKKLQ